MTAIFEIQQISKRRRNTGKPGAGYLFSDVAAEISVPDRIALIGASGQGKSTLLRILALLEAPDEGNLRFKGVTFKQMNPRHWRMAVSYVAQQAVMLPGSVEDNLRAASRLHELPYDPALAAQLLEQLGLDDLDLGKAAADCSGGEKQRIALIRTLLLRPSILLLDEITASLDIASTQKVEALLLKWHREEGASLIWITHDLQQASRFSSRTWVMGRGRLEEHSSEAFYKEPEALLVDKYIQSKEGSMRR
ncbi:ATP-binding cassette domain-containing protein [Paenibacillus sp. S150]|uniref:ABC transporter ATP-binding protein n=1 Tax=Paenibacillus sp. S150 TaxID=2749826 RepID=UPI001C55F7E9|nr:ATP-binding cassette domain-containing protein [Paenibacillus sp. S150]MBW4080663.1 ATP-binding cassette domain-containing protein [Paenibacillus sp. S150]